MKKLLKWWFVLIPVLAIIIFIIIAALIPNPSDEEIKEKTKEFTTKDSRVTFTAAESYKQEEKGEYDLYLNKNNKQILRVYTYNLSDYEENSSKEILDHTVNSFISTKEDMKLFKKESRTEFDDKIVTTVEYSGKQKDSSDCVYIFSTIDFKTDTNYVVYVSEVILENRFEEHIEEMINILNNAKLN